MYHNKWRLKPGWRQRTFRDPRRLQKELPSRISYILFAVLRLLYHHLVVLVAWVMAQTFSRYFRTTHPQTCPPESFWSRQPTGQRCFHVQLLKPQPQKVLPKKRTDYEANLSHNQSIFPRFWDTSCCGWKFGSSSLFPFSDHPTSPAMWRIIATLCCFSLRTTPRRSWMKLGCWIAPVVKGAVNRC